MSLENVCIHNKFGFCKFGEMCFRLHKNEICENDKCGILRCPLRHPKTCRYFGKFRNCKFGTYCKFKHENEEKEEIVTSNYYDEEIAKLKGKSKEFEDKIVEKEKEIKILDEIISEKILELGKMKDLEDENLKLKEKIDDLEKQLKDDKVKVDELEKENESLRNTVAVNDMLHEDFKERMKNKYLYDSDDEESDYDSNDESRERKREVFRKKKQEKRYKMIENDKKNNKCEKCDFIGKSEGGLKTHRRKKHG